MILPFTKLQDERDVYPTVSFSHSQATLEPEGSVNPLGTETSIVEPTLNVTPGLKLSMMFAVVVLACAVA